MTRPDEALMDRGGMASSALRVFVNPTNLFALALAFLLGLAAPAAAQTVVGGVQPPSVTVDQSVLDSLGPPQTLPDLLRGAPPQRRATAPTQPRERSAQHQVKAKKKKVVAKAKPKRHPPAVAAHKAAPVAPVAATAPAVPRESVAATPLAEPKAAPAAPNATATPAPSDTATAAPSDTAAAAPSATAAIPPAPPAEAATEAASPSPETAPPPPPPSEAKAAPVPVKPATPTVAPPSRVPTASPSHAAETAMAAPPSLPPAPPVAATPVTPVAAPAAVAAAAGGSTRVLFAAGAADLPDAAKPELDALVQRLSSNDEARLQLVAHASGSSDQANEARRISLQRALAVRSYLIEHGIASTRMDVRALGNRSDSAAGDPLDRVDVIMLER
jgi:outer membrane protein OmpA-like peptidoglycan-associated protein